MNQNIILITCDAIYNLSDKIKLWVVSVSNHFARRVYGVKHSLIPHRKFFMLICQFTL
jgi:hypothetical protein